MSDSVSATVQPERSALRPTALGRTLPPCPRSDGPGWGWSLADLAALGYCGPEALHSPQARQSTLYGTELARIGAEAWGVLPAGWRVVTFPSYAELAEAGALPEPEPAAPVAPAAPTPEPAPAAGWAQLSLF